MVLAADTRAEPPVAQPLRTLTNGRPVRPRSATMASALPPSRDPPAAGFPPGAPPAVGEVQVGPADPGVVQGLPHRVHAHRPRRDSVVAPERMQADTDDRHLGPVHAALPSAGAKA